MRRYQYLEKSRPGVDVKDVDPTLLTVLNEIGRRIGQKITIFSGYRTDAYSKSVGGFAGDPHTRHIAVDAKVGGTDFTRYPGVAGLLRSFGVVSGDQPNFYRHQPDPSHVQLRDENPNHYDFTECMALWIRAGGPPGVAPVAAAVALAESGGNPDAHCLNCAGVAEDSRGLWQINVGPNANPQYRSHNLYDPMTNARAAVAIFKGRRRSFSAWSTYTSGKYQQYGPDNQPVSPPPPAKKAKTPPRPPRPTQGGAGGDSAEQIAAIYSPVFDPSFGFNPFDLLDPHKVEGLVTGIWHDIEHAGSATWGVAKAIGHVATAFVHLVVWLTSVRNWLRMVEFLVGIGLLLKALNFLAEGQGGAAAELAQKAGGRVDRVQRAVEPPVMRSERARAANRSAPKKKRKRSKTKTVATAVVTRGRSAK